MRTFLSGFALLYLLIWNVLNAQDGIGLDSEPNWMDAEAAALWNEEIPESVTFTELVKKPISVSNCSLENLDPISWLTEVEKKSLLAYFKNHSPLKSLLEIQSIPEISVEKARLLIRTFSLTDQGNSGSLWHSFLKDGRSQITLRWGKSIQSTTDDSKYNSSTKEYFGSDDQLFIRLKHFKSGYFSYGLVAEKDAGEEVWVTSKNTRVDYLSGHIFLEHISKRLEKIALGDYRLRIGQGLILDNGFQKTGVSDFGSLVKSSEFLVPYNSVQENQMLRGAAIKLKLSSSLSVNLFVSKSKIDANISNPDTVENSIYPETFTSILTSGLHRNEAENEDHNALDILQTGTQINFLHRNGNVGFASVFTKYGKEKLSNGIPYQLYQQYRSKQLYFTAFYQQQFKNTMFFGETATDQNMNLATLNGFLIGLAKQANAVFVYRNFSPNFHTHQSQTMSINGKSQNETGLFSGLNLMFNHKIQCNIHFDNWQIPWLKSRSDLPSTGKEWAVRIQYTKRKKWLMYAQISNRERQENQIQAKENELASIQNQNLRIHLEQKLSSDWTWRSRCEWHTFCKNKSRDQGMLIYVDLLYKSLEQAFSGNVRWSIFDTDSYNSRIYAYENDVLYAYSVPSNSGKGSMFYLNLRYKSIQNFTAELRFSYRFQYPYLLNTGSQISAETPSQKGIRLQLNYSF